MSDSVPAPAKKTRIPTVTRVVRLCVDVPSLSAEQVDLLDRHAGTARLTWNWALGLKNDFERLVKDTAMALLAAELGTDDPDALKTALADKAIRDRIFKAAKADIEAAGGPKQSDFSAFSLSARQTRMARAGEDPWGWWVSEKHGVSRFALSSALQDLDAAVQKFYTGPKRPPSNKKLKPRKDGRPGGWPHFKSKHKHDPTFALFSIPTTEASLLRRGNRLKLPNVGTIRVHDDLSTLRTMIRNGGVPKSARFTSKAGKWYISVNVSFLAVSPFVQPQPLTKAQKRAGDVGVSLGIAHAATLSDGTRLPNPRVLAQFEAKRLRIQQRLSMLKGPKPGKAPSNEWKRVKQRQARIEAKIALERKRLTNELTKSLSTNYAAVSIRKTDVDLMVRRPAPVKSEVHPDGFEKNGATKQSRLNRGVLDVAFGEIVRQLTYKTDWYGSELRLISPEYPAARTCSNCGFVKDEFPLEIRIFDCEECGVSIERAYNAAINVHREGRMLVAARRHCRYTS